MLISGDELLKQARELLEKGEKLDIAADQFSCLLNGTLHGHGDKAVLTFYLACAYMKRNQNGLAIALFENALREKPDFDQAANNLGYCYRQEGIHDKGIEYFRKAYEILNKYPETDDEKKKKEITINKADYLINIASMLIANGTPQEALNILDRAIKVLDKPEARWNRALAYLELGDYDKGFGEHDISDKVIRMNRNNYGVENLPFWDGTKGKTVVVYGNQGIGDEIMFASVLPDVMKDCNVILEAHPRLADLFRMNFPTIPVYGTRKVQDEQIGWSKYHNIDAKIAIGSLCKFYRRKIEDFSKMPYLFADQRLVEKYDEKLNKLGDKPKIGISWRGGTKITNECNRYIPLELLLPILSLDNCDFISLQYNKDVGDEVKAFEDAHGISLNHWQDTLDDYDETAGLVKNLDIIISVPQSVVHLAGALGKHTLQMCPYKSMWQMGAYEKDMPWYSCVKNVWQDKTCRWEPVIEKVKDELCSLLLMTTNS